MAVARVTIDQASAATASKLMVPETIDKVAAVVSGPVVVRTTG